MTDADEQKEQLKEYLRNNIYLDVEAYRQKLGNIEFRFFAALFTAFEYY
ncbi:MAG: hypothetical protein LBC74_12170 [Planctomycetaceae bacterium]|nr:hypothetical protein [Planctomycetaceae bacterium]